ncbi:MAG: RICIN domain-containing protein [Myxococcales bacterium]|nr:RICIN domain-containing protein [Myxococcales bacterium]
MHRFTFAALLTFAGAAALLAGASAASAETTYTCTCDGYCGNGARGANPGTIVKGVAASRLQREFGLDGAGTSNRTGWRCEAKGPIRTIATNRDFKPLPTPRAKATPAYLARNASPIYLRASDAPLYLHAHGGTSVGAQETLHACPKDSFHPNCQWVLEPSPTTSGAFYVRSLGGPLYLHAHGGTNNGANLTLHACPKNADHPNCQWFFEPSPTRLGTFYLRSKGGDLYAHSHGGSSAGARNTLHACPRGNDHPNCQWQIEVAGR